MLRATIRSLLARKLRLLLSGVAVILGVAFVSGTFVLSDTLNRTFDNLFGEIDANTAVAVRSVANLDSSFGTADRSPVPGGLLGQLQSVPGVASAEGNADGSALVVGKDGKAVRVGAQAPNLGLAFVDSPLSQLRLTSGSAPGPNDIAIDRATADASGYALGDTVPVITRAGRQDFRLSGIFTFGSSNSLAGATLTAFDLPVAQRLLLGDPGVFSDIKLAADSGVSQAELRDRVSAVLPAGVEAITGKDLTAENSNSIKQGLSFFTSFLLVFAGIALFVGAFIIFNTFSMLVAQRTRELALMRAIGASRGQVTRSVLLEAVLVGTIGAAVGLVLGVGFAFVLRAALSAFGVTLPSGGLVFAPRTVIAAFAVGIVVTSVAALFPARRAARTAPVAAMRDAAETRARGLALRTGLGVLLLVLGGAVAAAGLAQERFAPVGLGLLVIVLGVLVVSPAISAPLIGVLGRPLRRMPAGKLGQENAIRNPRRTSATAASLLIGLALVSAVSVLAASTRSSVRDVVTSSFGAQYVVQTSDFSGFGPEVGDRARQVPGVTSVSSVKQTQIEVNGAGASVTALSPDALTDQVLTLQRREGNTSALPPGVLLVSEQAAKDRGLSPGEPVRVTWSATGEQTYRVGGVYGANALAGDYVVSTETYDANVSQPLDFAVLVKATQGADVRPGLEEITTAFPNVEVLDQSEFIKSQEDQINQLLGIIFVLLALAILIAVLGIVNTLALSIVERTREIGLLRAVGLQRRQLRMMILDESVLVSVFGAVVGVVLGTVGGLVLVRAAKNQGITSYQVPWVQLVVFLVLTAVAGVLASILPSRRAAKMNVLSAISTS